MPYEPTRQERLEELKPYIGPVIATVIVVAVITWVTWRQLSPPPRAKAVALDTTDRIAAARASEVLARSEAAESEARELLARGKRADAAEKLRAALRWQQQANASLPNEAARDVQREVRLAAALAETEATPLRDTVELNRTLATAAVAREQWDEALKAFTEARKAQVELNEKFPGSRYADPAAIDKFDAGILAVNASRLAVESGQREREAEQAVTEGNLARAGAAFEEAANLQREINDKFARSPFVSAARVEALAVRHDTALATADLARAAALEREATQMLRARKLEPAGDRLLEAATLLQRVSSSLPRARNLDAALREKVNFLSTARPDLPGVQDRVISRLRPLPVGAAQMLETEVPQSLYQAVMRANPSRHSGRGLPVDSVSWQDAQEFCRRLGWMLAAHVRLPTEAEFRAAFGRDTKDGAAELAAGAWSAENAEGHPHETGTAPAGPAGLCDLAGNLAEWLEAPAAADAAPVAGGSYLDAPEALRKVPIVSADKRERARHIGFRVVVEWN